MRKITIILIIVALMPVLCLAQVMTSNSKGKINYEEKGDTLYLIVTDSALIKRHVSFIYEHKVPMKKKEETYKQEATTPSPTAESSAAIDQTAATTPETNLDNDSTATQREVINTIYHRMDASDDLEENHPAADIYANLWQSGDVNPYRIPLDSIPDSTVIDLTGYTIPVPLPGNVTSKFGPRRYRYHYGTDLKVQMGDTIVAAWDGQVRYTKYNPGGYGYYIVIRHPNGLETVYGHLSRILVVPNQHVKSGETIALGGSTGRSTGPHLHFETRYLGNPINSESLFDYTLRTTRSDTYLITKRKNAMQQQSVQDLGAVKYYTIRKGDTLGAIAKRNGTSVSRLCKLNGIRENSILQIGKRIRVR